MPSVLPLVTIWDPITNTAGYSTVVDTAELSNSLALKVAIPFSSQKCFAKELMAVELKNSVEENFRVFITEAQFGTAHSEAI